MFMVTKYYTLKITRENEFVE